MKRNNKCCKMACGVDWGLLAEEVGFEPTEACTSHDFQSCSLDHYETPPKAERVGFEPTKACTLPLFESGTFDHSDISPCRSITHLFFFGKHFSPANTLTPH